MSNSFDLDIRNYTIRDIEKLFGLNENIDYKPADIEYKEADIRERLLTSGAVNNLFTADLISFLNKAKLWLLTLRCKEQKQTPTTLPNNLKMDAIEYLNSHITESRSDELINRPPTDYIMTRPDEYYAGTLNPLNNRVITKCLVIDSRFRDNIYSTPPSDFLVHLPSKLNKVVSMELSAIEYPLVTYTISAEKGNNYLVWQVGKESTENNNGLNTEIYGWQRAIVPDGNYTGSDLIAVLNSLIDPRDANGTSMYKDNAIGGTNDFKSFQNTWFKLTLDITSNGSGSAKVLVEPSEYAIVNKIIVNYVFFDFSLGPDFFPDGVDITKKLGWMLGFKKTKYKGIYFLSDSLCEVYQIRYMYLCIDDFTNNSNQLFITSQAKSDIDKNVLARISCRGQSYFSLLAHDDYSIISEPRKYFGPVDIKTLGVRVLDEYGRLTDMKNVDFSFCLTFKLLYDL